MAVAVAVAVAMAVSGAGRSQWKTDDVIVTVFIFVCHPTSSTNREREQRNKAAAALSLLCSPKTRNHGASRRLQAQTERMLITETHGCWLTSTSSICCRGVQRFYCLMGGV